MSVRIPVCNGGGVIMYVWDAFVYGRICVFVYVWDVFVYVWDVFVYVWDVFV